MTMRVLSRRAVSEEGNVGVGIVDIVGGDEIVVVAAVMVVGNSTSDARIVRPSRGDHRWNGTKLVAKKERVEKK